jgi:hypothetical protein
MSPLPSTRLRRLRSLVRDESGTSLVLALLVAAALTISTASLTSLVTSNETSFGRDRQEARAFNVAEAGLNYAVSYLTTFDNGEAAIGSKVGIPSPRTYSLDGTNNGSWWAEKTAADTWKIWSSGKIGKVTRNLYVEVTPNAVITNSPSSYAWHYGLFVASATGCTNFVGGSDVTMSVWAAGDLCLSGGQKIHEPSLIGAQEVDLYVGKKLYLGGGSLVGTSTRPVNSVTVVGGCETNKPVICSQASKSGVYARPNPPCPSPPATDASGNILACGYGSSASTLTKPAVFPQNEYDKGDWSHPVCSVGSFTFDNDATRNTSVGGISLLTTSAYDCEVWDPAHTQSVARLAWNPVTHALSITGVVYLDGNLSFGNNSYGNYTGFGTIYVNGSVTTNGGSSLCGPGATAAGSTCTGQWLGSLGAITVIALNGWAMTGNAEFNVAAYVVGNYDDGGTANVTGPIITDTAKVHGTSDSTDVTDPPPGTPGASGHSVTTNWRAKSGTWRQLAGG